MKRLFYILAILSIGCQTRPNPFGSVHDIIPNLNYGGCGFFAYHLHKLDPNRYAIVALGGHDHVMLYDMNELAWLDADGYHNNVVITGLTYGAFMNSVIADTTLRTLLNDSSIWNPTFKRKDTVKLYRLIDSLYIR